MTYATCEASATVTCLWSTAQGFAQSGLVPWCAEVLLRSPLLTEGEMPGPLPVSPSDEEPEDRAPVGVRVGMVGARPLLHPPRSLPRTPQQVAPVRRLGGHRGRCPQMLGPVIPFASADAGSDADSGSDSEDFICPPRVGDVHLGGFDVAGLHPEGGGPQGLR
jgi:hypothetical protein